MGRRFGADRARRRRARLARRDLAGARRAREFRVGLPAQRACAGRRCASAAGRRARTAAHLWFFSSSEAIDHLLQACPGRDWTAAQAIATHPRIARRARVGGFGRVEQTRPTLDAVVACIQSIAS
jgi:uroporphyrinogen-III synthase